VPSVRARIINEMSGADRGKVYCRAEFCHVAPRASVNRALKQLVDAGTVRRIGRGLYDLPRYNELLDGYAPVQLDQVLQAIQRRDKVRLMPDGFTAANNLGLTTAVPAKITFYTDGSSRNIVVGNWTITLKRARGALMSWHSRPGRDVLLALKWLGRQNVDEAVIQRLQGLPHETKEDLLDGLDYMPRWIANTLKTLIK